MSFISETSLVIDIGKTNIKIHVLDKFKKNLVSFNKKNKICKKPPYHKVDVEDIWSWMIKIIKSTANKFQISSIVVSTHGATAALVSQSNDDSGLVLPIMDYEWNGLKSINEKYENIRPSFKETFSPSLPAGLNLGRQLLWLEKNFPNKFKKADVLLMYPQYWAWRLTGIFSSEISSIGCHTDLWEPKTNKFSSLVNSQNWNKLFPPFKNAWDVLGNISKDISDITGLSRTCRVHVGVHDSNASFLRFMLAKKNEDFCVVSTGTWVVCMANQKSLNSLDQSKDMLVNINVEGHPVPCIRFMGGREYEKICSITKTKDSKVVTKKDIYQIINNQVMAFPSFSKGNGPFGSYESKIQGTPQNGAALATLYCAMMITFCLNKLNFKGDVILVGSFLKNTILCQIVAQLCSDKDVYISSDQAATIKGAAQLTDWSKSVSLNLKKCEPCGIDNLESYMSFWQYAGDLK